MLKLFVSTSKPRNEGFHFKLNSYDLSVTHKIVLSQKGWEIELEKLNITKKIGRTEKKRVNKDRFFSRQKNTEKELAVIKMNYRKKRRERRKKVCEQKFHLNFLWMTKERRRKFSRMSK
jgi:hypothetical protein